ncbi:FtsQ-type POTRA domain-containing protein [Aneurinibacillus sp. Ricciae_BoGa-3]|uniref:cell division protein FtsQ/DivIB n=1 Tax=Aneurinibacillus sp. Ricciae_BoGa-3 TaxID=3022697 RepID=UPI00233FE75C|nr:FtsQ-type POTRA domain-containing protein [Aneurinibacillus sp. Ricciae_BoGa-3]WCK53081.1 FtsQ-type POTRA domain-containing protein [Aneurinibacillus sp. Ricciae_BoGa-3]
MAQNEKIPRLREEKRKKAANKPLLLLVFIFFMVVLLVLFFRSSISKLQSISVTGNQYATRDEIIKNSGLSFNMQFLFIDKNKVADSILKTNPAVQSVDIIKSFPGKIELHIKEKPLVALLMDKAGRLYPVTSTGSILQNHPVNETAVDKPIIRNWTGPAQLPVLAVQLGKTGPAVSQQISEISNSPQDSQRLILFMKDGFEVHTTLAKFADYMAWYPSFVQSLKQEGKTEGIINLSEVKWFEPYPQPPDAKQSDATKSDTQQTDSGQSTQKKSDKSKTASP